MIYNCEFCSARLDCWNEDLKRTKFLNFKKEKRCLVFLQKQTGNLKYFDFKRVLKFALSVN